MIYGKAMELDSMYNCMSKQDTNSTTIEEDLNANPFAKEEVPAGQVLANQTIANNYINYPKSPY